MHSTSHCVGDLLRKVPLMHPVHWIDVLVCGACVSFDKTNIYRTPYNGQKSAETGPNFLLSFHGTALTALVGAKILRCGH